MKTKGRKPTWTTQQLEAAVAAYATGATSTRLVKEQFGVPPTTLLRYCRENKIPVRTPGLVGVKRDRHPTWKGGFRVDKDGYIRTYAPDHPWPRKGGYVHEHVRVMELHIGRRIRRGEVVHHRDENKTNNDLENLELMTAGKHSSLHRQNDHHLRSRDECGRYC